MSESLLRLMVVAREQSERVQNAWTELSAFFAARTDVSVVRPAIGQALDPEAAAIDLVLVLGGDGAILRACHQLGTNQVPVLGINLGRLGFLADLSPDEFRQNFDLIQRREYRVVEHLMFECTIHEANGRSQSHLGLNEAAIRAAGLQMLDVELSIDGEPVTTYSGDGLIVSTPVGSTAHSLSAGGPLLRQDLQAFVITPICPHALSNRPLVDHAERVYSLTVPNTDGGAMLVVDGQVRHRLKRGDRVEVRRASVTFKLARVGGHSFYDTLHRKLGWAGHTWGVLG